MGERRGAHGIFVVKPEGKCNLKNLGLDGRTVLKQVL
jgi:hypothetical protein